MVARGRCRLGMAFLRNAMFQSLQDSKNAMPAVFVAIAHAIINHTCLAACQQVHSPLHTPRGGWSRENFEPGAQSPTTVHSHKHQVHGKYPANLVEVEEQARIFAI